jgi:lipoprotein NlpI
MGLPTTIVYLVLLALAAPAQTAEDQLRDAAAAAKAGKTEEAIALATKAIALDPKNADALRLRAGLYEATENYKDAIADLTQLIALDAKDAASYRRRGLVHFQLGKIDESIRDFDRFIELRPDAKASHWQRGISYYYAGRYDEGRQQFEGYQDFDSNDVENAVWRFMCMAKKDGLPRARAAILKIGDDRRVPMRQVYDLFKGDLKPADVLAAARAGDPSMDELNRRLFYAHLYVGIYQELAGDRKAALDHLKQAVEHRIPHYMWDVARIHRQLLAKAAERSDS